MPTLAETIAVDNAMAFSQPDHAIDITYGALTVIYSLEVDADGAMAIDAGTGEITVAGALDFATAPSLSITALATYSNGTGEREVIVITVLASGDPGTGAPYEINEDAIVGDSVGVVSIGGNATAGATIRALFRDGESAMAVAGLNAVTDVAIITVQKSDMATVVKGTAITANGDAYEVERRIGGGVLNHEILLRKNQAQRLGRR